MNRKFALPLILLVLFSLVLSACAPAATPTAPVVQPTNVPVVEPTAPVAVLEPVAVLDFQAEWDALIADIPADKGYGTVTAAKLNEELVENPPFLVDIREAGEIEKDGYIDGAVHIPVRELMDNLGALPAMDKPIVIYCASGHRGGYALAALKLLGYSNVRNLAGGLGAWKKAELPVETGPIPAAIAGTEPEIKDQALFEAFQDFFQNLHEGFYATKADALNADLIDGKEFFLLDVRRADEFKKNGHLADAVNIPLEELFSSLDQLPAKDTAIVIYCVSGHRAAVAQMGLRLLGYENILNLGGGFNAWKAAGFPVEGVVDWSAVWGEFLAGLPADFYTITAANLNAAMADAAPFLLDVREVGEIEKDGYIAGAVHIPVRELLDNLDKLPAQDEKIVIYCASGHRGGFAMAALRLLGYSDVVNLGGGLGAWKKAELPVKTEGMPEAPAAGSAPSVDPLRLDALRAFLADLPEGFLATKAADLNIALGEDDAPFVLDVRTADEYINDGYIDGSVNIPVNDLWNNLDQLPAKDAAIVVVCKSGHRGAIALMALKMNGYTSVTNLAGGTNAWVAAELPLVK